jgi:hypothetical protein
MPLRNPNGSLLQTMDQIPEDRACVPGKGVRSVLPCWSYRSNMNVSFSFRESE